MFLQCGFRPMALEEMSTKETSALEYVMVTVTLTRKATIGQKRTCVYDVDIMCILRSLSIRGFV